MSHLTTHILDTSRGRPAAGVDVVLDSIGASYLERNLAALANDGALVLIGLMGGAKAEVNLGLRLTRRLKVFGSTLRTRSNEEKAEIVRDFLGRFGGDLAAGTIRPVLHRVFPHNQPCGDHNTPVDDTFAQPGRAVHHDVWKRHRMIKNRVRIRMDLSEKKRVAHLGARDNAPPGHHR